VPRQFLDGGLGDVGVGLGPQQDGRVSPRRGREPEREKEKKKIEEVREKR